MKNYRVSGNREQGSVYPSKAELKPGTKVKVVQKQDQRTGKMTEGIIKIILTNSSAHPHGIKVKLESGIVGRIKEIIE